MTSNQLYKFVITLFVNSLLIIGFLLHGVVPTISHAAVITTITSDGTIGTQVTQNGRVYNIDGGTIKGSNLFQSFRLFNVGTGDTASFNGPNGIENIMSRITGGQQSMIDGLLRSTIPGANLYLLNPAGVLLGQNAKLDVSGSFYVSTADFVRLGSDGIFYANLSNQSVLVTAPPSAFGFLSNTPAAISLQDSVLIVPNDKTLSIVGGDIGIIRSSLWAPSGQINLVSVASIGEVNLSDLSTNLFTKLGNITVSGNSSALNLNVAGSNYNTDPAGTIIIKGGKLFFKDANIAARGNPGGTINTSGEELHLDNTFVNTATRGAVNHPGTAVEINVSGDVLFTNGSEIASSGYSTGRAGDVQITAGNMQLGDDDPTTSLYANTGYYGDIGSRAYGSGRGGDVYITADNLTVKNGFFINTAALSWGDAGNVTVHTGTLKLLDGGSISSNGLGVGKGGVVDVVAGDVLISGKNITNVPNCPGCFSGLAAQAGYWSKGGLLKLTADNLQILDGGKISTNLFSIGPGADIEINAKNILISGVVNDNRISPPDIHAGIDSRLIGTYASGTGGNISIIADSLQVTNGGYIDSSLDNAPGNAGNISIQTKSLEVSERGGIFASSLYGTGNAGSLDITAKDVRIIGAESTPDPFGKDFTGLSTATKDGRGGDLRLTADNLLLTDRGSITSGSFGSGQAGNIEINSVSVELLSGSCILASAFGSGNGGSIEVTSDSLLISGVHPELYIDLHGNTTLSPSGIASQAWTNGGSAGNIRISTGSLEVLDGAKISTETLGSGDGGRIEIDSKSVLISGINAGFKKFLTEHGIDAAEADRAASASILTSTNRSFLGDAATGNAGNLRIKAQNLQVQDGGLISSGTETPGAGGIIDIKVDRLDLTTGGEISSSSKGKGQAGSVTVTAAESVSILGNNSGFFSTASDAGDGGVISVSTPSLNIDSGRIDTGTGRDSVGDAGSIALDVGTLTLFGWGNITTNSLGSGKGGDLTVKASEYVFINAGNLHSSASSTGDGGAISISTPWLVLGWYGNIDAGTYGGGDAGSITLNVKKLTSSGYISTSSWGSGKGGDLTVNASESVFIDSGGLWSTAMGTGDGGHISIFTPSLNIDGGRIDTGTSLLGDAGSIALDVGKLTLTGVAAISTSSQGSGKGGNLTVKASESVFIDSGGLYSDTMSIGEGGIISISTPSLNIKDGDITAETYGEGDAGSIALDVGTLTLTGVAKITTSSWGSGKGGDLTVNASESVSIDSGGLYSDAWGNGEGGVISITTPSLVLDNGGVIDAETYGEGDAGSILLDVGKLTLTGGDISTSSYGSGKGGDLTVKASESVFINSGNLLSSAFSTGDGGVISISTPSLVLEDAALVSAKSSGQGNAGNINISAVTFRSSNSSVTTEAKQADGGNIQINAQYMVNLIDSKITASVGGGPETVGGNITIDPHFVILNDSQVIANAYEGRGGNIRIVGDVFLASPESIVSASSALGIDGTVDIRAPITSISGSLVPMQGNFLSAESLLRDRCAARIRGEKYSSFIISGRDGLPIKPGSVLPSPVYLEEDIKVEPSSRGVSLSDKPVLDFSVPEFDTKVFSSGLGCNNEDLDCFTCVEKREMSYKDSE